MAMGKAHRAMGGVDGTMGRAGSDKEVYEAMGIALKRRGWIGRGNYGEVYGTMGIVIGTNGNVYGAICRARVSI